MDQIGQNTSESGGYYGHVLVSRDAAYKNDMTTVTTTTNTYSSDSGNMIFASLFVFLIAIFLLFFLRVGLGFCLVYRRDHTCAETCVRFMTLKWICQECSREEQSTLQPNSSDPANVQPNVTSLSLYDLPDYEDALSLPRLDSSTILGDPPPLYRSLEKTKGCPVIGGGHENPTFMDANDISARENYRGYLPEILEASDVSREGASVVLGNGDSIDPGSTSEGMCDDRVRPITLPRALRSRVMHHQNHARESNDFYVSNYGDMDLSPYQLSGGDEPSDPQQTERASTSFVSVSFMLEEPESLPSYQEAMEFNIGTNL